MKESQEHVYDLEEVEEEDTRTCLRFSEPRPQHNELWEKLFADYEKGCEAPPLLENIQVVMDNDSSTGAHIQQESM